jgi:Arc/MetJ-type ribon-helix-helix transcriptional regulator
MEITLKPETIQRIGEKIRRGEFDSADAMVEQAVTFFLDYEKDEMREDEFLKVKLAVAEAQEQAERGEGVSIDEFEKHMRAKYGIQR